MSHSDQTDIPFGFGHRSHGIGIEVREEQVWIFVGGSGKAVVFDEAWEVGDQIKAAANVACDNAVEGHR
jgi:hypothetical protein